MSQRELPAGIQLLLRRGSFSCSEAEFVQFRQEHLRKRVTEVAEAHENGRELLREAAAMQLGSGDIDMIDHALAVMFVVGVASDAAVIQPLLSHPADRVQKAARTCLFEIRRRNG